MNPAAMPGDPFTCVLDSHPDSLLHQTADGIMWATRREVESTLIPSIIIREVFTTPNIRNAGALTQEILALHESWMVKIRFSSEDARTEDGMPEGWCQLNSRMLRDTADEDIVALYPIHDGQPWRPAPWPKVGGEG